MACFNAIFGKRQAQGSVARGHDAVPASIFLRPAGNVSVSGVMAERSLMPSIEVVVSERAELEPDAITTSPKSSVPGSKLRLTDVELLAVARFLAFGDVAHLAVAAGEAMSLLTAPTPVSSHIAGHDDAMPRRQLVVPVAAVELHSMDILKRASAKHMEILRLCSRGAFEELKRVLRDEGAGAFAALERFSAKGCNIKACDVEVLAPLIGGSPKLCLVNFERNALQDGVVSGLANSGCLARSSFDTLNLRFNLVGDGTAQSVARVLAAPHPTLETVNFKMNRITDVGAIALAEALPQNRILRVLNLRRQHPGLTDKTAKAMARALDENMMLKRLLLRRNLITDEGCQALAAMIARRFERLPGVRFELDLEENRVGVIGGVALARCLRHVGPAADVEVLLHSNPGVNRDLIRHALAESGEDPSCADDYRLRIETSKPEMQV